MNNNKSKTMLTVGLWLAPIIIGIALAIGAYREKQDALAIRVAAVETLTSANLIAVTTLQTDIAHIKQSLKRIEDNQNRKN